MGQESMLDRALEELYLEHLNSLKRGASNTLDAHGFDAVLVSTGQGLQHYRDDGGFAFRASPDFARWVGGLDANRDTQASMTGSRLLNSTGHFVLFDQDKLKPTLFLSSDAKSPWYQKPGIPPRAEEFFDLNIGVNDEIQKALQGHLNGRRVAGVGRKSDFSPELLALENFTHEPAKFLVDMDRAGVAKTPFEIAAIRRANENTARGHRAALNAFLGFSTEGEILMDFSKAARQREAYQAYPPIAGIGSHGAILHYESADFEYGKGDSLLLDAGTTHLGYAADVTSTFVRSGVHSEFRSLVKGLDQIQKELVPILQVGATYNEAQRAMHIKLGQLLIDVGILRNCTALEAAEARLTHVFCPHSIGHSLGVRTHDRGNMLLDENGEMVKQDEDYPDPILRRRYAVADFQENSVMTVEPGIYFIPGVLNGYRNDPRFNWKLIDQLEGGARIETNVWITRQALQGNVDLTRLALPKGTNA